MKNNIKKRVLAGFMALAVGAGIAGTCGYQRSVNVEAKEEDVEELQQAAKNALGDSKSDETDGVYKDESVYVKADASGKVTKTTVTEWLKNLEKGDFCDVTSLDNIKNVKGDEEFTKGNGEELSWKSQGNDIYYQGSSKKKLPVDVKISYKLDGQDISPEDLKGKDGKVEIKIDYKNHSKETVDVGGEQVEMYTPFTMVTALMLSTDEYKNVTIDHGKIVSDADKNIVLGVAFPGLTEDLGVEDLDFDLPESVTIAADVKDATVSPTVTIASAEILDQFDLSDVKDFDDLSDSVNELENAANQLVDGSKEAADGADTLADGANKLADGSKTLADGSKTLSDGLHTLNSKSGDLTKGVNDLAAGVNKYTSSISSLASGSAGVAKGAQGVDAGVAQIQTGVGKAKAGADAIAAGIADANTKINTLVADISSGLSDTSKALSSAYAALDNIRADAELTNQDAIIEAAANAAVNAAGEVDETTKNAIKAAVENELRSQLSDGNNLKVTVTGKDAAKSWMNGAQGGIAEIQNGIKEKTPAFQKGMAALSQGAMGLQTGLGNGTEKEPGLTVAMSNLKSGTNELSTGASTLAQGAAALNDSGSLLTIGTKKLQDGGSRLALGVGQLADGADSVADGAGTVADGNKTLADGAAALADGNHTLADGMSEFKAEGIDELTSLFDGDIQNVTDRLDAMTTLGQNYKSFAGIKDGMSGSTKFIIVTEGVD